MEENKKQYPEVIDLREIVGKLWKDRKLFYKVLPIVFVFSCIYIFSLPRYYSTSTKLVPEMENSGTNSTLNSLTSTFGIDIMGMESTDAISPFLYPDLMDDNGFVNRLMDIKVVSQDGEIEASYHDYLKSFQKYPWWSGITRWLKNLLPKKQDNGGGNTGFDPYNLSRDEDGLYNSARGNIEITVDKKTGIISIVTVAQDPLICRTLADSVKVHLQDFITEYRTSKARTDYEYYQELNDNAWEIYEDVRNKYARQSDAYTNVTLKSSKQRLEDIENDMLIKYKNYTAVNTQLQAAKAKVQERTPVFTMLKGADVPLRPAGPKRMFFVAFMLFIATIGTAFYVLIKR